MNLGYLRHRVNVCEIKRSRIARELGITESALSKKLNGKRKFFPDEILDLFEILDLTHEEKVIILFTNGA